MSKERLHAGETTAIGAGMVGASAAANYGLDKILERKGLHKPVKAAFKRKLHPAHIPYAAAKVATTSLRTVGIPLAAYGAFNMASPSGKIARIRIKDDVIKPTFNTATGRAQADEARKRLAANKTSRAESVTKTDLTDADKETLSRRKNSGRKLSLASGTMGLAALSLRAPEIARVATKAPQLNKLKSLKALAMKEPGATKASNALGIAAIGTGSVGSFNYASQQKLERKQVTKSLPIEGVMAGIGKVRVLSQHSKIGRAHV